MRLELLPKLVLLAALIPSTSACSPSKELTRQKALELLQAAPSEILTEAKSDNLVYARVSIPKGRAVSCEAQKRLAFAEALVRAGTLGKNVQEYPERNLHTGANPIRPAETVYEFRVADSKYAQRLSEQYATITLLMGKAHIADVTGIKQEGAQAVGEAMFVFDPTPILQVLADTESSFSGSGQPDKQCKELYSLPDPVTKSFRFERYDDGWRLAKRNR